MPSVTQSSGLKSGSNVATANGSFAVLPAVGNACLVLISGWNAGDLAFAEGNVTDNQGNSYKLDRAHSNNTGHGAAAIFRCSRIQTSAGTFTVTVASNKGAGNFFDFCLLEITGFNGQLRLDQVNGGTGGAPTQPIPTGNIVVTEDENLIAAVMEIASTEGSIAIESTTPAWVERFEQLSFAVNSPGEGDTKVVGPGTYGANWTVGTTAQFAACIASYSTVGQPPVRRAPSIGVPTVLSGNVIVATPARAINIEYLTTGAAILEGSLDGINFITLDTAPGAGMRIVNGVVAPYLRPSVDITVIFRKTKSKM
jgi:hypothetical protein